jgi:putative nucleotidyltransferase with HDIG domain
MIFGKAARKRSRLGSGIHRLSPPSGRSKWVRPRILHWTALGVAFVALTASLALEVKPRKQIVNYDFETEQMAQEDIRADIDFKSEDRAATAQAREAAARQVPDVYRVDQDAIAQQLKELQQRIDALASQRDELDKAIRQALLASDSTQETGPLVWTAVVDYARKLTGKPPFEELRDAEPLAAWLLPDPASLPNRRFEGGANAGAAPQKVAGLDEPSVKPLQYAYFDALGRASRNAIQFVLTYGILPPDARALPADSVAQRQSTKIRILRDRPIGGMNRTEEIPLIQVPVPADALKLLEARTAEFVASDSGKPAGPLDLTEVQNAAYEMARPGITDTLHLDKVETLAAREAARGDVKPVLRQIYRNQFLQRAGEPWTEQSRADVRALLDKKRELEGSPTRLLPKLVAAAILAGLTLAGLVKALTILKSKKEKSRAPMYVALVIMCATLILGRIVSYFGDLGYLVPLTASAILLAILTNARVAAIMAFLTAALLSAQFGYDWQLFVVSGAMALSGALSVHVVRRRNEMTRAAVAATIVGLLATAAVSLSTDSLAGGSIHRLVLIALNGLACVFIVPGLLPPLERLFGITTDIQLLEYSDLNNEVLSRMAIEVPATYAHSLMLGQLAEAAADAIGANGLLARVSAYYHDIGKLRRPEYFSENQTNGNVHDTLTPRLSARAIAAHVLQGAEMAREAHLPKPIIDGIVEHHGTSLISFFYQQAVAQCKHGDVREEDFRYPGPKPQSRETAILMICDAVESGVRSIKNPNEDRVREFVDKIVAARAADRQFDESDLTLKDLDVIADVVTKRILTSLHTRIAYPEPDRGEKKPLLQVGGAKD